MVTTFIIAPELAALIIILPVFLVLLPLHAWPTTTTATGATSLCAYCPFATSTAPSLSRSAVPYPYLCAHAAPAAPYPYAPSPCPALHDVHLCGLTHAPDHDFRPRLCTCSFVRGCRYGVLVLEKKQKKQNQKVLMSKSAVFLMMDG